MKHLCTFNVTTTRPRYAHYAFATLGLLSRVFVHETFARTSSGTHDFYLNPRVPHARFESCLLAKLSIVNASLCVFSTLRSAFHFGCLPILWRHAHCTTKGRSLHQTSYPQTFPLSVSVLIFLEIPTLCYDYYVCPPFAC